MKSKEEIVQNWLPRYTGEALEKAAGIHGLAVQELITALNEVALRGK